jgi:hypothetical protein
MPRTRLLRKKHTPLTDVLVKSSGGNTWWLVYVLTLMTYLVTWHVLLATSIGWILGGKGMESARWGAVTGVIATFFVSIFEWEYHRSTSDTYREELRTHLYSHLTILSSTLLFAMVIITLALWWSDNNKEMLWGVCLLAALMVSTFVAWVFQPNVMLGVRNFWSVMDRVLSKTPDALTFQRRLLTEDKGRPPNEDEEEEDEEKEEEEEEEEEEAQQQKTAPVAPPPPYSKKSNTRKKRRR